MTDEKKKSIEDVWLETLTGKDDVTGQFLDSEQAEAIEEAELLREAILSINEKEDALTDDIDIEKSTEKLLGRLKKDKLL